MEIQKTAINRALSLLCAAGAKFKIIEADGTQHGELECMPERTRRRRNGAHPFGSFTNYFRPLVEAIPENGAAVVPWGVFTSSEDKTSLVKSITAWLSQHWGNGSYMTARGKEGVEILRMKA